MSTPSPDGGKGPARKGGQVRDFLAKCEAALGGLSQFVAEFSSRSDVDANGPYAAFRMGTVVSFATNQAVVSIGGTSFPAAYLVGATFTAGDLVYVSRQGGSWVIHGALAGVGSNELADANPSFEDSAPGTEPDLWFLANVSGSSSAVVQEVAGAPDGTQVRRVDQEAVNPWLELVREVFVPGPQAAPPPVVPAK